MGSRLHQCFGGVHPVSELLCRGRVRAVFLTKLWTMVIKEMAMAWAGPQQVDSWAGFVEHVCMLDHVGLVDIAAAGSASHTTESSSTASDRGPALYARIAIGPECKPLEPANQQQAPHTAQPCAGSRWLSSGSSCRSASDRKDKGMPWMLA